MRNIQRQAVYGRWLSSALILLILFTGSGCQEDTNDSRAASANARAASDQRLDKAVSSFQDALGQEDTQTYEDPPTLKWSTPQTREDGSRLYAEEIKGYRIYYRLKYRTEFEVISIPDSDTNQYTLSGFEPGAYEFSVTALDEQERESRRSDAVSVNLI